MYQGEYLGSLLERRGLAEARVRVQRGLADEDGEALGVRTLDAGTVVGPEVGDLQGLAVDLEAAQGALLVAHDAVMRVSHAGTGPPRGQTESLAAGNV